MNGSLTGVAYWVVLPRQSSPPPFSPQPQAFPCVSTARPLSYGMTSAGMDAIFTPAGKRTRTGRVKEFTRGPSPS